MPVTMVTRALEVVVKSKNQMIDTTKKNTAEVQRDADTDTVVPEKKENAVVSEEAEETVDMNDEEVGKRLK